MIFCLSVKECYSDQYNGVGTATEIRDNFLLTISIHCLNLKQDSCKKCYRPRFP